MFTRPPWAPKAVLFLFLVMEWHVEYLAHSYQVPYLFQTQTCSCILTQIPWCVSQTHLPLLRDFSLGLDTTTERLICPGWETLVVPVSQPGTPGRDKRGRSFCPGSGNRDKRSFFFLFSFSQFFFYFNYTFAFQLNLCIRI